MNNTSISDVAYSGLPNTTPNNTFYLNSQPNILYCSYFTRSQCDQILLAKNVSVSIAIIACVISIVVMILLSKYRRIAQMFALIIVMTNTLSLILTLNDPHASTATYKCSTIGMLSQGFDMATLFFMAELTVFMALRLIRDLDTSNYAWLYMGIGWTIPFAFAVIPQANDLYGPAGAWCWIKEGEQGNVYRFVLYWVPAVMITVAVFVVFLMMWIYGIRYVKYIGRDSEAQQRIIENRHLPDYLRPFVIFAGVFVIGNVLQFVNRINDVVNGPNYRLHIMAIIGWDLNCIVLACVLISMNERSDYRPENIKTAVRSKYSEIKEFFRKGNTDEAEPYNLPSAKSTLNRPVRGADEPGPSGIDNQAFSQTPRESNEETDQPSSDDFVVVPGPMDEGCVDLDDISLSSDTQEIQNNEHQLQPDDNEVCSIPKNNSKNY